MRAGEPGRVTQRQVRTALTRRSTRSTRRRLRWSSSADQRGAGLGRLGPRRRGSGSRFGSERGGRPAPAVADRRVPLRRAARPARRTGGLTGEQTAAGSPRPRSGRSRSPSPMRCARRRGVAADRCTCGRCTPWSTRFTPRLGRRALGPADQPGRPGRDARAVRRRRDARRPRTRRADLARDSRAVMHCGGTSAG